MDKCKKGAQKQRRLSTPLYMYLVIIGISLLLILICCLLEISDNCRNNMVSMSISLFASVAVTILIDFANTQMDNKRSLRVV